MGTSAVAAHVCPGHRLAHDLRSERAFWARGHALPCPPVPPFPSLVMKGFPVQVRRRALKNTLQFGPLALKQPSSLFSGSTPGSTRGWLVTRDRRRHNGPDRVQAPGPLQLRHGTMVTITSLTRDDRLRRDRWGCGSDGVGTNDQSNGVCVCRHHHRLQRAPRLRSVTDPHSGMTIAELRGIVGGGPDRRARRDRQRVRVALRH